MATLRTSANSYNIGSPPPELVWTLVRGDTASFKVYVTDDSLAALYIPDWDIEMDIKRDELVVVTLTPESILNTPSGDDDEPEPIPGEFLVKLAAEQSDLLKTADVFDIQMTNTSTNPGSIGYGQVWTVARGTVVVIEDITR
jgi:hypothetical protein